MKTPRGTARRLRRKTSRHWVILERDSSIRQGTWQDPTTAGEIKVFAPSPETAYKKAGVKPPVGERGESL
jgi:hypothetical protein